MIKQISRKNLNIEKYSKCLEECVNYRIYAEFWYLDIVANKNWDCLVLNDYEAIMPLPFSSKFIVKMILQPFFCQQLGVFHRENFTKENFSQFEKKLHKKIVRSYQYNEENTEMFSPKGEKKVNQILDLNFEMEDYISKLRKNRKQEIRKGLPQEYEIRFSNDYDEIVNFINQDHHYKNLKKINFKEIFKKSENEIITITHENIIISASLYIYSKNRIIQLINSKSKNDFNYNLFIIEKIIKENLNKNFILDFEGSMIKGVNEFNSSLRAIEKEYVLYKNISL